MESESWLVAGGSFYTQHLPGDTGAVRFKRIGSTSSFVLLNSSLGMAGRDPLCDLESVHDEARAISQVVFAYSSHVTTTFALHCVAFVLLFCKFQQPQVRAATTTPFWVAEKV